ncbi:hypothetical protein BGZ79_009370 [Entomortierella chlamydospora]|nr:hypothetical protein BGZ79_009370 [Entomortierella chlamydospora]
MSLDWRFFTSDVMAAGSISSQIFEIGGHSCKAELTITKETGNVAFHIRSLVDPESVGGMKASLKARACTIERDITVGNQITRMNLYTSYRFSNFLTRTILQKYDELLIEIGVQPEINPDPPLKTFWNCPATSDIVIVGGSADEKPVFVHKKFVLEVIPKILRFITGVNGSKMGPATVPRIFEQSLTSNGHSCAGLELVPKHYNLNKVTDKCEGPPGDAITTATKTDSRSESLSEDRKQSTAANQPIVAGNVNSKRPRHDSDTNGTVHIPEGKDEKTVKNVDIAKSRAEEGVQANLPVIPPTSKVGSNHEVWLWPSSLPKNSCIDVMRWIYLKRLSPEFNLEAFNPFMKLLADLDQWHHFQENALRARGLVFQESKLLQLLREPIFKEGYASMYLKEPLMELMKLDQQNMLRKYYQQLQEIDRTGIVQEFLKNNKILNP